MKLFSQSEVKHIEPTKLYLTIEVISFGEK